jgi:DNA adenine methylase
MTTLPHPIPYQGSKRALAARISRFVPGEIETWFEPFAGSAAMSLWAARHRSPRRIVLCDVLEPLTRLWGEIIERPVDVADRYQAIWNGQAEDDPDYFNRVRDRFNAGGDPVELLYLLCRCVKNAVRFNARGHFTQSVDRRRLGMRPDRMRGALAGASALFKGRTELRSGDWLASLHDAGPDDFIYLDPPYHGTSTGRDRRYADGLARETLIGGLQALNARGLRYALSYDGLSGERSYGPPLPPELRLTQHLLHAGRSSQATLNGRAEDTVESLYVAAGLVERSAAQPSGTQASLPLQP